MTALNLSRLLGLDCLYTVNGLEIAVRILDAKRSYGRTRYLVTPIQGSKSVWVETGLVLPEQKET